MLPAFFGKSGSENNALYRQFGIKQRSNEEMRADYVKKARELVEDHLKLKLPEVAEAA
jgi:ring-1,2-phenylacetyl-CoA epoxidase subunit PaaA